MGSRHLSYVLLETSKINEKIKNRSDLISSSSSFVGPKELSARCLSQGEVGSDYTEHSISQCLVR